MTINQIKPFINDHNESEALQQMFIEQEQTSVDKEVTSQPTKSKFIVKVEWSGFSRGYSFYEVEAVSETEAKEYYGDGKLLQRNLIHDDTKKQSSTIITATNKAA